MLKPALSTAKLIDKCVVPAIELRSASMPSHLESRSIGQENGRDN